MAGDAEFEAHKLCVQAKSSVKVGGTLYVGVHQMKIYEQPVMYCRVIGMALAGDEVTWLGAAPENNVYHKIRIKLTYLQLVNKPAVGTIIEGYVYGGNLKICKPLRFPFIKDR